MERSVDVLDENLIAFAKSRNIAVVTTVVLFKALQLIKDGTLDKNRVGEVLNSAKGLLTFEDFTRAA